MEDHRGPPGSGQQLEGRRGVGHEAAPGALSVVSGRIKVPHRPTIEAEDAMPISNQRASTRPFLRVLYDDGYYPDHVVDRGRAILLALCERIERERPADLAALYALTQAATEEFNDLEAAFEAAGSEIETVAREETAEDFAFVASAYGFPDADVEELIATREW
jgi:hypothetical protein